MSNQHDNFLCSVIRRFVEWAFLEPGTMTHAITIEGIQKRYGAVHALRGIDLIIEEGEFFALLGPNGAGKSTLINILAGLTKADSGRAAIAGHDVITDYRRARRALGVVPQELVFDPFFTVREVLRMQAGYFGLGRANEPWLEELLHELMLTDKADTNMRALSGGMKRRVLVAQALVHKPPVLVLDEPTAGVDVALRQSLWRFVKRLHKEGHTIVLTTHYLEEAETLCERIGILDHGQLIALDRTTTLMKAHLSDQRRARLTVDDVPPNWPNSFAPAVVSQNGRELVVQLTSEIGLIEILTQLRDMGVTVAEVATTSADLEDIFVSLTAGRAN